VHDGRDAFAASSTASTFRAAFNPNNGRMNPTRRITNSCST
jgi:hypothetical protein